MQLILEILQYIQSFNIVQEDWGTWNEIEKFPRSMRWKLSKGINASTKGHTSKNTHPTECIILMQQQVNLWVQWKYIWFLCQQGSNIKLFINFIQAPWYDWITGYVYKIQWFQFRKMHLKMLSAKWQPFYPGLNVLKENYLYAINSSLPCAAYMPQWTGSALVQAMACRLLGAKPLHEPMLAYYRLDFWQ